MRSPNKKIAKLERVVEASIREIGSKGHTYDLTINSLLTKTNELRESDASRAPVLQSSESTTSRGMHRASRGEDCAKFYDSSNIAIGMNC